MKNSVLFYTTRGLSGDVADNFHNHIGILNTVAKNIDYLTAAKTDRSKILFKEKANLEIKNVLNLYSKDFDTFKLMKSWEEVYNKIDVSYLKNYEAFFIMGGMFFPQSNLSRLSKRVGIFPKDSAQLKFESVATHAVNILAILKAHREYRIPLHEWCKTPEEITTNLFHENFKPIPELGATYHGFDLKVYEQNRLDSLQYKFENDISPKLDKKYDITFGLTVFGNTEREKYLEDLQNSFGKNSNFFIKNKKTGENTFLPNDQYFEKIKESYYTFIIPPYDENSFSIYRFVESLAMDCLPLIHPSCKISDVEESFSTDLKPLQRLQKFDTIEEYNYHLEKYKKDFLPFRKGFKEL